jgi:two-component system, LytTR family, response regulator
MRETGMYLKSDIINLKGVNSFDSHNLYIGEHEVPLGEVYKNEFFSRFLGNQAE